MNFQSHEPFTPLFGGTRRLWPYFRLQEYLGFSNHQAFLSTMWEEFLHLDTYARGRDRLLPQLPMVRCSNINERLYPA
ncbi:hypothetical protein [Bacteroides sp. 51]|uniref:hypothetical protein n=1 Tax=Bacteroides sp. 51 TaxID=2302938 RepID=UPI0013D54C33|nr:hypothetical protein [Bacteroides sp. 51]